MLMLACDENLKPLIGIIKGVLQLIQILVPIGLIVFGTIDLGKAVIASKEDEIKKAQQTLMKRAITAALVFLVATIVTFVMGFVGSTGWNDCWRESNKCKSPNPMTGECCSYDATDKYDSASGKCK